MTAEPIDAPLDRCAEERERDGLIAALLADRGTRLLSVEADEILVDAEGRPISVDITAFSEPPRAAFLGRDVAGRAVLVTDQAPASSGERASVRAVGAELAPGVLRELLTAVALGRWLRNNGFCPRCGAAALIALAGWSRRCTGCGAELFPRNDPAVIVAISSADGERLLLGANAAWQGRMHSCFAGFVEAGESAEDAVRREIREEAGVELAEVRYSASQSWPFPHSLMLGFHGVAVDEAAARPDGSEIVGVHWWTRAEVRAAFAGEGDVRLPGGASIAHRLIREWCAKA